MGVKLMFDISIPALDSIQTIVINEIYKHIDYQEIVINELWKLVDHIDMVVDGDSTFADLSDSTFADLGDLTFNDLDKTWKEVPLSITHD